MSEMITVTTAGCAMPNRRLPALGLHAVEVRKLTLSWAIDGTDLTIRKVATSTTSTMTKADGAGRQQGEDPVADAGLPAAGAQPAPNPEPETGDAASPMPTAERLAGPDARSLRRRRARIAPAGAVDRLAADARRRQRRVLGADGAADRSWSLALA